MKIRRNSWLEKKGVVIAFVVVVSLITGFAGYWLGRLSAPSVKVAAEPSSVNSVLSSASEPSKPESEEPERGPTVYLSPSNQFDNDYVNGGTEGEQMNKIADAMIPYLEASGVDYILADPDKSLERV